MGALSRGLGETASDNATAFGFSLTIGGVGLITADLHGSPAVGEVFLMIGGGAAAMILIAMLATRAFQHETPDQLPERAQMRGAALNFLSVGAGLLVAWGAASLFDGGLAWALSGFGGIFAYLVVEALEYAATLRFEQR